MVNKVKDIGIKTRICYFHNDMNIKKLIQIISKQSKSHTNMFLFTTWDM